MRSKFSKGDEVCLDKEENIRKKLEEKYHKTTARNIYYSPDWISSYKKRPISNMKRGVIERVFRGHGGTPAYRIRDILTGASGLVIEAELILYKDKVAQEAKRKLEELKKKNPFSAISTFDQLKEEL